MSEDTPTEQDPSSEQDQPQGQQTSQPNDTAGDPTAVKDPSDWVTGDEPATGAQKSYLATLATESGADVPAEPTKAEASVLIDELKDQSTRIAKG